MNIHAMMAHVINPLPKEVNWNLLCMIRSLAGVPTSLAAEEGAKHFLVKMCSLSARLLSLLWRIFSSLARRWHPISMCPKPRLVRTATRKRLKPVRGTTVMMMEIPGAIFISTWNATIIITCQRSTNACYIYIERRMYQDKQYQPYSDIQHNTIVSHVLPSTITSDIFYHHIGIDQRPFAQHVQPLEHPSTPPQWNSC